MAFFSIIIPTYNRYELTKKAIDSVLNQTYKDFELIIVDDGSTDNTHRIEYEYNNKLTYVRKKNGGVSSARNMGIAASNSKYIALLDSDDEWLPSKLEEHKVFLSNNPDIKIHQTEEIWIRNNKQVNQKNKHKKKSGDIFLSSLELCIVSPSAVVLDQEILDRYGLFDELLPACEDYDFWLRITSEEKIGLINKKLVIKNGGHEDQLSKKYWGMDRFRVYSIIKLLKETNNLKNNYKKHAKKIALEKCEILIKGALKRNKNRFAEEIGRIKDYLIYENYSSIDYQILL